MFKFVISCANFRAFTFVLFVCVLVGASLVHAADYDCLIEPYQSLEISSAATGVVDKVHVKRGDRVSKGQIVFTLESNVEAAAAELAKFKSQSLGAVKAAQSKIEFTQKKYERRKEMAAENLTSKQERDDAESELRLAEAELLAAKESRVQAGLEFKQQSSALALRTVRSTIDGVVVDQMLYPGETAEPGGKKPVLKLAQLDPLKVRVMLPMAVFGKLKHGQVIELSPEHASQTKLQATVRHTDKVLDAASGTHMVFLDLPNKALNTPAGTKCKAHLDF
jgi:RND family efflux transporter MFP subunit